MKMTLKEMGKVLAAAVEAFRGFEDSLAKLPPEIIANMSTPKLDVLKMQLEKVYGDRDKAKRMIDQLVKEAVGRWFPDDYLVQELNFEINWALSGGQFSPDFLASHFPTKPDVWILRGTRDREIVFDNGYLGSRTPIDLSKFKELYLNKPNKK